MTHLVLKQRHSLIGRSLLPLITEFRESSPVVQLGRLKKEYPLEDYSIDELSSEFQKLTGEKCEDVLLLAGKDYNLDSLRQLMHACINFANMYGAPKGSNLAAPQPGPSHAPQAGPSQSLGHTAHSPASDDTRNDNDGSIEGRVKKMEDNLESIRSKQDGDKVNDALKQVRMLAGRPKLTSPGVLLASLEVLVESATKVGHKETEYYARALQTCRQYEDNDDFCSLCLKLLGSAEDKKISSIIADWVKTKKYEKVNKNEENSKEKETVTPPTPHVPYMSSFPYPFPFQMPMAPNYPMGPSNYQFGRQMTRGRNQRLPRRGSCFFCKATGHYISECPKKKDAGTN